MVTLEVVTRRYTLLPRSLQKLFLDWNIQRSTFYAIYTINLEYLGDDHLDALDAAYKACQIDHWVTGFDDEFSASTYNK